MRDDIAAPSIGAAEKEYTQQFFYRSHRDLEIFLQKLLSKGPVKISSLTADSLTISGNVTVGGALTADSADISGGVVTTDGIKFPATQVASANANTLDDYEEGTWTPVLTFATPGNLNVAYSGQSGTYTKIGRLVSLSFSVITTTFTHTTASGNLSLTGGPFSLNNTARGSVQFNGFTSPSLTQLVSYPSATSVLLVGSGYGTGSVTINVSHTATGTNLSLTGALVGIG